MILIAVGCCLGAAAFAATRPEADNSRARDTSGPLQPRFTEHPDRVMTVSTARFDTAQPGRPPVQAVPGKPLRLECRLDGGRWERCQPPLSLTDLDLGPHRFEVRAVNASGRSGPAADFSWRIHRSPIEPAAASPPSASPLPAPPTETPSETPNVTPPPPSPPPANGAAFTIEQVAPLDDLFPGEPAQSLALRLTNPNPAPVVVTSLTFSFAADPPGCPSAENFIIVPSDASAETPLTIPPETRVDLPAQGVSPPQIAMRELAVDQNACQGAALELKLEGEAQG